MYYKDQSEEVRERKYPRWSNHTIERCWNLKFMDPRNYPSYAREKIREHKEAQASKEAELLKEKEKEAAKAPNSAWGREEMRPKRVHEVKASDEEKEKEKEKQEAAGSSKDPKKTKKEEKKNDKKRRPSNSSEIERKQKRKKEEEKDDDVLE